MVPKSAVVLLLASLLQVAAPVVTFLGPGQSPAQGGGDDLLIGPAGWAFAIWGPVYALAIAQAVGLLLTRTSAPRRLVADLLALYLAGVAWITVAALGSSPGTAAVLVVMAVAAVDGVLTASRTGVGPRWLTLLTRAAIGLYAGWVTAAMFVNLSSATVATGLLGARDPGWQLVVLLVAATVALAVLATSGGNPAYAVAVVWAFAGITATTVGASATLLTVAAVVAAVAVVVVAVTARRRTAPA